MAQNGVIEHLISMSDLELPLKNHGLEFSTSFSVARSAFLLLKRLNADTASEVVNLSEVARSSPDGISIVCDMLGFIYAAVEHVAASRNSVFFATAGGEYSLIDAAVETVLKTLRDNKIRLIGLLDPAQGTDADFTAKLAVWKSRFGDTLTVNKQLESFCSGSITEFAQCPLPKLASAQVTSTIRRYGGSVTVALGEADVRLVQLMEQSGSFALTGNDSDFYVIDGARYIPLTSLLSPLSPDSTSTAPLSLFDSAFRGDILVHLYTPKSVAAALQIPQSRLASLAALCGNDFTGALVDKHGLSERLNIATYRVPRSNFKRSRPEDVAAWLRQFPADLEDIPTISDLLDRDPELAHALEHSAGFYAKTLPEDELPQTDNPDMQRMLTQGLVNGTYSGFTLAVYNYGRMWLNPSMESLKKGSPCGQMLHRNIRRAIYSLFGKSQVTEYGRVKDAAQFGEEIVLPIDGFPNMLSVVSLGEAEREKLFRSAVFSHCKSPLPSAAEDPLRGLSNELRWAGFILRYLLSLNNAFPIAITEAEFDALVTTVIALARSAPAHDVELANEAMSALSGRKAPNMRAISIASWYQTAIQHVHALAAYVNVGDNFPDPRFLFSGSVFQELLLNPDGELNSRITSSYIADFSRLRNAVLLPTSDFGFAVAAAVTISVSGSESEREQPVDFLAAEARSAIPASPLPAYASDDNEDADVADDLMSDKDSQEAELDYPVAELENLDLGSPVAPIPLVLPTVLPTLTDADRRLPIEDHREEILTAIQKNHVICIQGETGCGKSSMVPQFLLEEADAQKKPVKIIVTQPRRIAAIMLARRVASQRNEKVGESVGYRIAREAVGGPQTQLWFVTTGYLLQQLAHNGDALKTYTHVILDEVHERSMEGDLLSLVLKVMLPKHGLGTKLIVMSATLQANLFRSYFTIKGSPPPPEPIFVGARCFDVKEYYLEDVNKAVKLPESTLPKLQKLIKDFDQGKKIKTLSGATEILPKPDLPDGLMDVVVRLVTALAQPGDCILVFVPGIGEITALDQLFQKSPHHGLSVLPLHSLMPREEQEQAFAPPAPGKCKIVLATNIAESSITIPDVLYVVDCGLQRHVTFSEQRGMPALVRTWCSQASCQQRKGRAGRVRPGMVFRMFTRHFFTNCMPEFDSAEILRLPLESIVLHVKTLLSSLGTVTELLAQAVEPPSTVRVAIALQRLADLGALTTASEHAKVTALGYLAVHMPVDIAMAKLVLLGVAFGCECDAVVIAAALSIQDVFSLPSKLFMRDMKEYSEHLKSSFLSRAKFDKQACSEAIMYRNLYMDFLASRRDPAWAHRNAVSFHRMKQLDSMVNDLCVRVADYFRTTGRFNPARLDLLANSRRESVVPDKLFTSDERMLRFVIASAAAPVFLQGSVRKGHQRDKIVQKNGMDMRRTLVLAKIPPTTRDDDINGAIRFVSQSVTKVVMLPKREALIEFEADAEWQKHRGAMEDLPNEAKLLLQYMSGRFQAVVPNPRKTLIPGDQPDIKLGSFTAANQITWSVQTQTGVSAMMNWRSPVAGAVEARPDCTSVFAVAASLMGTESPKTVHAEGITVLPTAGLFGQVCALMLASSDQQVRACVSSDGQYISAATVGTAMITFAPGHLVPDDIKLINEVRSVITTILFRPDLDVKAAQRAAQALQTLWKLLENREKPNVAEGAKWHWVPLHEPTPEQLKKKALSTGKPEDHNDKPSTADSDDESDEDSSDSENEEADNTAHTEMLLRASSGGVSAADLYLPAFRMPSLDDVIEQQKRQKGGRLPPGAMERTMALLSNFFASPASLKIDIKFLSGASKRLAGSVEAACRQIGLITPSLQLSKSKAGGATHFICTVSVGNQVVGTIRDSKRKTAKKLALGGIIQFLRTVDESSMPPPPSVSATPSKPQKTNVPVGLLFKQIHELLGPDADALTVEQTGKKSDKTARVRVHGKVLGEAKGKFALPDALQIAIAILDHTQAPRSEKSVQGGPGPKSRQQVSVSTPPSGTLSMKTPPSSRPPLKTPLSTPTTPAEDTPDVNYKKFKSQCRRLLHVLNRQGMDARLEASGRTWTCTLTSNGEVVGRGRGRKGDALLEAYKAAAVNLTDLVRQMDTSAGDTVTTSTTVLQSPQTPLQAPFQQSPSAPLSAPQVFYPKPRASLKTPTTAPSQPSAKAQQRALEKQAKREKLVRLQRDLTRGTDSEESDEVDDLPLKQVGRGKGAKQTFQASHSSPSQPVPRPPASLLSDSSGEDDVPSRGPTSAPSVRKRSNAGRRQPPPSK